MNPELDGDLPLFGNDCDTYDWKEVNIYSRPTPANVVPGPDGEWVNPYHMFPIQYYAEPGEVKMKHHKKHRKKDGKKHHKKHHH